MHSPLLEELTQALCVLPGVGPRSAQRMVMHLLERDIEGAHRLSIALTEAADNIGRCARCRTFTEHELCKVCQHPERDPSRLCIVESPMEIMALENVTGYTGQYFVLMGKLSPLDGIGPKELALDVLENRLAEGEVNEVILAVNPTVEGEVTVNYLLNLFKPYNIEVSRIAYGVPFGGELEFVDNTTLAHAFNSRAAV